MTQRSQPATEAKYRSPGLPSILVLASLLAGTPVGLSAEPSLRDSPATIEADRAELDRHAGTSRYAGNVEFTLGDLRITADTMLIRAPAGQLERAEAQGEPARLAHRAETGERIRAHARSIVYEPGVPRLTLVGEAEIGRGGDRFRAARIVYALDSGRIDAERDEHERVRITIQPQTIDGDDEGDSDE